MAVKSTNERIILGLKVRQKRLEKNLSFAELSEKSGMSVSYLNEIEKGKKYPKEEKIKALAMALDISPKELTSPELDPALAPVGELLRSNFLNELPLDLFGIELSKVVEIIANSPTRVNAFISTLLELSRNYALNEESFFFGALRSYLQLHNNYFEETEKRVRAFEEQYQIPGERPLKQNQLASILQKEFGYEIVENGLDDIKELGNLRSLFLPHDKKLLLHGRLTGMQKQFQFGKELAFQILKLKERANTSSIIEARSFEEVLNHSKAIYFSVALHMPLDAVREDMSRFFQSAEWQGEAFLAIAKKYDASPEMFYHRLTNVLPRFFGIKKLFFTRFTHDPEKERFEVDRELHLNRPHRPHSNGLNEHYCRRWVATSLLQDLHDLQKEGTFVQAIVRAQRTCYLGTNDEYLCFTIARPSHPNPKRNVSVTLGLLLDQELKKNIRFLDDPSIQKREVNITCERCAVTDCKERAAPPVIVERRKRKLRVQEKLKELYS